MVKALMVLMIASPSFESLSGEKRILVGPCGLTCKLRWPYRGMSL